MIRFQTEPIIRQIIMGYKHTFEIITKDIQDIEKLVGNFENYSEIPYIELDLALSKLRNVYELLLMFRDGGNMSGSSPAPGAISEAELHSRPPQPKPAHMPEPVNEKPQQQENPDPPVVKTSPEISENTATKENFGVTEKAQPVTGPADHENHILAEKFQSQKSFINEKLAESTKKQDVSSRLLTAPITSISGTMGINDKFFFIRELFKGDAEKFRATMDNLEHADNFNEAYNFLVDNFDWDMESIEVLQLISLMKRKFLTS